MVLNALRKHEPCRTGVELAAEWAFIYARADCVLMFCLQQHAFRTEKFRKYLLFEFSPAVAHTPVLCDALRKCREGAHGKQQ